MGRIRRKTRRKTKQPGSFDVTGYSDVDRVNILPGRRRTRGRRVSYIGLFADNSDNERAPKKSVIRGRRLTRKQKVVPAKRESPQVARTLESHVSEIKEFVEMKALARTVKQAIHNLDGHVILKERRSYIKDDAEHILPMAVQLLCDVKWSVSDEKCFKNMDFDICYELKGEFTLIPSVAAEYPFFKENDFAEYCFFGYNGGATAPGGILLAVNITTQRRIHDFEMIVLQSGKELGRSTVSDFLNSTEIVLQDEVDSQ